MKVKIVEKKDNVKEMTIEEALGYNFVGLRSGGTGNKYVLHILNGRYWWLQPPNCHAYGDWDTKRKALEIANDRGQVYVFDEEEEPAKKLYLWMAE